MRTIGNFLRSEREAKKISLSEVSNWTKVSEQYLDSLEKGDYEKIPQGPYLRGYISSYAAYIGINKDEALKRYESSQLDRIKSEEITSGIPKKKNRQWLNEIFKRKIG
jgi:cytoskeleton protein RodZ